MSWFVLIISAVFEAVWATALGESNGLTELLPTVVFFIGIAVSLAGLAYAMKTIPVGVAYSVWVGVGAALTVAVAMVAGNEPVSFVKLLFLAGIVGSVVGLKLVSRHTPDEREAL